MVKIADVILKRLIISTSFVLCISIASFAQPMNSADSALTLGQCIDYALKHQPFINQALVNQAIVRTTNAINLSSWYPQVNASANLTHYNSRPTQYIVDSAGGIHLQRSGVINTLIPVLGVSQTIFNPALLYATRSAPLYNEQAQQITDSTKIDIVAGVSKTFYSLLLTLEQIGVLKEDTSRLTKNVSDTYHQYIAGIVDETDYDEALISLNNSKFQLKQATENVNPQYAMLKQVMGYPPKSQFNVIYDTIQMKNDIAFDTTQELQFERRIEYKVLQTQKALQLANINYYRKAWLPTAGAFFNYDYEFQSNSFGDLLSRSYPYSYMGLSLTMPIFQGFYRTNNIKRARLQNDLLDLSEMNLKSQIYTEYATALASYKSNLYNLSISNENIALAKKTYDIVMLQYQQGVVPYLNVITAESNLITSEISYQNALFTVLSSKIDLQRSMGFIVIH
jgi:outer membrane protein TolC